MEKKILFIFIVLSLFLSFKEKEKTIKLEGYFVLIEEQGLHFFDNDVRPVIISRLLFIGDKLPKLKNIKEVNLINSLYNNPIQIYHATKFYNNEENASKIKSIINIRYGFCDDTLKTQLFSNNYKLIKYNQKDLGLSEYSTNAKLFIFKGKIEAFHFGDEDIKINEENIIFRNYIYFSDTSNQLELYLVILYEEKEKLFFYDSMRNK